MKNTILIRINPASNGFSVVLTNHNIPGTENRQQLNYATWPEVETGITEFLTQVDETDKAQTAAAAKAEAERKAQEKADAAAAANERPAPKTQEEPATPADHELDASASTPPAQP